MSLLGILVTLFAAVCFTFRFSYLKDLGKYAVSKESVNLWYRAFSLPVIIIFMLVTKTELVITPQFWLWFLVALIAGTLFSLYQVYALQAHDFSSVESLSFLGIFFTTIGGYFIFNEILSFRELIGAGVISLAFILLVFSEHKRANNGALMQIFFYYLFVGVVDITNKQAVLVSSPIIYVFALTLGTVVTNFLLAYFGKNKLYKLENKEANALLLKVGLFAALSFIAISYGYKLLPVGIVAAVLSLKVFISLWLSKTKYQETNLIPKYIASAIAFLGIVILVS